MQFNSLIPELSVENLLDSLRFYVDTLGFKIEYQRIEDKFALVSFENVQLMLEQVNGHWETAPLEKPFGRGINFQIATNHLEALVHRLQKKGISLFRPAENQQYTVNGTIYRQREFLVQDPDGYLLRFCQKIES
ncbi:MAG: VOC family protein [Proteobacteria bacterium]|nr:VOC family protein [Pseudomonadota bacterium]